MEEPEAVEEVLAYLDGLRSAQVRPNAQHDTSIAIRRLAQLGFQVTPIKRQVAAPRSLVMLSQEITPEQIKATRLALAVSHSELASQAGLAKPTVKSAEAPGSLTRQITRKKIVNALVQLGATLSDRAADRP